MTSRTALNLLADLNARTVRLNFEAQPGVPAEPTPTRAAIAMLNTLLSETDVFGHPQPDPQKEHP